MTSYRRERFDAVVAVAIWAAAALTTVGVSVWLGSARPVESAGGIPRWVVMGVFAPWLAFFAVHVWYTLFFMADGDSDEK